MYKTLAIVGVLSLAACSQKPASIVMHNGEKPQERPNFARQNDVPFTPVFNEIKQSAAVPVHEMAVRDLTAPEAPQPLATSKPVILHDPEAPHQIVAGAPVPHFRPETVKLVSVIKEHEGFKPFTVKPRLDAKNKFIWPVTGQVVSRFGAKSGGLYNDGVNIAAPEGAPIHASMDGQVVYAGNELASYGNLLIIRHKNGLLSAYAHTQEIMVKKGQKVKLGQVVAKVGKTGNVPTPQVHFAIRDGKKPLDPVLKVRG
jgi:murein DD-endopeptidase MepM/ murein hydrolase activator NlpD